MGFFHLVFGIYGGSGATSTTPDFIFFQAAEVFLPGHAAAEVFTVGYTAAEVGSDV